MSSWNAALQILLANSVIDRDLDRTLADPEIAPGIVARSAKFRGLNAAS
jgi:hypothetical protein